MSADNTADVALLAALQARPAGVHVLADLAKDAGLSPAVARAAAGRLSSRQLVAVAGEYAELRP